MIVVVVFALLVVDLLFELAQFSLLVELHSNNITKSRSKVYSMQMDEKWDRQEMEKKLREYALDNEKLKNVLKAAEEKEKELQKQLSDALSPNAIKKIEHPADLWTNIGNNCVKKTGPFGSESVKTMIKTGKMTVHDTDFNGETLLALAARSGAYDLAQFLINNVL